MKDIPRTIRLMLSFTLLAVSPALVAQTSEKTPQSDAVSSVTLELPHGKYRVFDTKNREYAVANSSKENITFSRNRFGGFNDDFLVQPVIESQDDLFRFIGIEKRQGLTQEKVASAQQVVPGIPNDPRFSDPRFDPTRSAFSGACKVEAGQYASNLSTLALADQFDVMRAKEDLWATSDGYENSCLTTLDEIPTPIKRVTGVLTQFQEGFWTTFCSATIIGPKEILTARHCFFSAETGKPTRYHTDLEDGRISFHPLTPHSDIPIYSVQFDVSTKSAIAAYSPKDDYIVLRVLEGPFQYHAEPWPSEIEGERLPLATWVVGNNAVLGDARKMQHPLGLVRGSAPKACSILEATTEGCLYHSCQTGKTTSGAGLLAILEDTVTLFGIHRGTIGAAKGCEPQPPLDLQLNLAARAPSFKEEER